MTFARTKTTITFLLFFGFMAYSVQKKIYHSIADIPYKDINLIESKTSCCWMLTVIDSTLVEGNRYGITLNCDWSIGSKPQIIDWSGSVICGYKSALDSENGRKQRAYFYISQDESGITITERHNNRGFMWLNSFLFSQIVMNFIQCAYFFNTYLCSDNYNGLSCKYETEDKQRVSFIVMFESASWTHE